tara:strand:- start:8 stop:334 length:327 start_codon:yes stop_codon:yes gene_type:complete
MTDKKNIQPLLKSRFDSADALKLEADMRKWTPAKRLVELNVLLADFMTLASIEQDGTCERCTSKLTKTNIKQSEFSTIIHRKCPATKRWYSLKRWPFASRYLKRHGVA